MARPASQFREIELPLTPAEAAAAWSGREGVVFLDSALESAGAISILACEPDEVIEGAAEDISRLARELEARRTETGDRALPQGAAIGWFAFDGSFRFGFYPHLLIYEHDRERWLAVGHPSLPGPEAVPASEREAARVTFRPEITSAAYCEMVRRTQGYIAAGDIYQACIAHRYRAPWQGPAWPFYEALRHYSPAPFAGYLGLGDTTVMSASPECFLRLSGRHVLTRPIKGTRPRRSESDADERSAYELITSPKEVAELVMITDLERNDLGRVCEYGSVHVSDLLRLERFEQVFHLVSSVEGTLRPEVSHVEAVAACFPGGSISGAPKKRALEIIAELEPASRGIYTGAVGFFGFNGESSFNIAIRTVVVQGGEASFHVGAGIVADSEPAKEWQETLDKAAGILLAAERVGAGSASVFAEGSQQEA
ncbi:MAG TPA: anthranilate synthase component I family protein [Chthoniobacterales bacterium]|nr:anthranilate synthase component I family protein [Chthoniobacterales bacterium]